MTGADGSRPDLPEPPDGAQPLDDGPVIDPLDPLGLGDLPLDHVPLGELPPDLLGPSRRTDERVDDAVTVAVAPHEGAAGESVTGRDVTADAPEPAVAEERVPVGEERTGTPQEAPEAALRGPEDAGAASSAAPPSVPTSVVPRVVVRPPRSGWARLAHAMRPRTTQGQLITAGLCALLGFALVVQVRQATDTQLGSLRQNDLVRLLDETTTRTEELEREAFDLQRERDELLSGSDRQQAALDAARRTAAMQGILTGRLPATGPGVRITLTEPDGEIRPVTMLHVLEELRNAGAEAMELNGHRIIASSAFTGNRGAVELDGAAITSPFRWTVIGDPDTIAPALEIPGGAMAQVRGDGGRGTVEKSDRVEVTAVRVLPDPVHATPASDEP
ncbi:protein of unknown function DUF881 [Cellulomonas flavigena DSM 20109]|uniref:Division initiation protein n=1 Tax=Cellulomonas flavigena (strain ATCC 482 / DSM 20109 / BCRC 11376 / JCM 18109 / NBRC 3775 / NCIMB 8073 / NRS 134) TaxID=446466 RepID=D5UEX4_CELFN|nr:DUF881 domain-containing protein [Cellulomonas flavigena]ADG74784.1 protein of unknown function DUF881 [Cellulomonas flavigena DSM 20109]